MRSGLLAIAAVLTALGAARIWGQAEDLDAMLNTAEQAFARGQIEQSVAAFDRLAAAAPRAMPQLWQRGIALYYAGRYDDCRKQFEAHRTVNPDDVENAAWHSCASPAPSRRHVRRPRYYRWARISACRCTRSMRCSRAP